MAATNHDPLKNKKISHIVRSTTVVDDFEEAKEQTIFESTTKVFSGPLETEADYDEKTCSDFENQADSEYEKRVLEKTKAAKVKLEKHIDFLDKSTRFTHTVATVVYLLVWGPIILLFFWIIFKFIFLS